ncbi:MAG: hypothetical protein IBX67_06650 [Dehalococcoidia bacterium]|nr:hypothetical protein [Dehalococcoidia bacterium]
MSEIRRMRAVLAGQRRGGSGRAGGRNGHSASSGRLAWYFAQPAGAALRYLLTAYGYVLV